MVKGRSYSLYKKEDIILEEPIMSKEMVMVEALVSIDNFEGSSNLVELGRLLTLDKNSFFENREFIRLADTGEFLEETIAESGSILHRLYRF